MVENKQRFISENAEIHKTIKTTLETSNSSIKVATAWFTDGELFNILLDKARQGISVEVLISDKKENQKLDFNKLKEAGASVIVHPSSSYGMMHQKYCISDDKIAIQGSYNWTKNAKENNEESVIVLKDQEIISQMNQNFLNLTKGISTKDISSAKNKNNSVMEIVKAANKEESLEYLFNQIIESEINEVDLEEIKKKGISSCKSSLGNIDTLLVHLANLKCQFKMDLTISEERKIKIVSKIEELSGRHENIVNVSYEEKLDLLKGKFFDDKLFLEKSIAEIQKQILASDANQKKIQLKKIESKKDEISLLREQLIDVRANLKTTSIAWYDLVPKIILGIGLAGIVFLFYSSAIYIMIYTKSGIQEILDSGGVPAIPSFFESHAISKAYNQGVAAVCLVCLSPMILFFLAFIKRYTQEWKKWQQVLVSVGAVLSIDVLIAFIISDVIHYSRFLIGEVDSPSFPITDIIYDLNFYSVLICGIVPLLFLKLVVSSIWTSLDIRNVDHMADELKITVEKFNGRIIHCLGTINEGKEELIELEKEFEGLKRDLNQEESKIKDAIINNDKLSDKMTLEKDKDLKYLKGLSDLYLARIENGNLLFDSNFLTHRLNSFVEGWNESLYSHYAQGVADNKVKEVAEIYGKWLNNSTINERVA